MELKKISVEAVPRAIELAERYRLLNEPEQAASICRDILSADPENRTALRMLILALTEEFGRRGGAAVQDVLALVAKMPTEYDRAYFSGVACERWARAKLLANAHLSMVGDWLRKAMDHYEAAESLREQGVDDALLRWNACARLIASDPRLAETTEAQIFGD